MAAPIRNPEWLEWIASVMGGTSRQTFAATLPPDHFWCLLDDLPLHLIPAGWAWPAPWAERQEIALNPLAVILRDGSIPKELAAYTTLLEKFALQGTVAWVPEPETESWLPFWLGPRLEQIVAALASMSGPLPTLPDEDRLLLAAAGLITTDEQTKRERERRHDEITRGAEMFHERGYAPLSGLIHPFHVAALRRYFRHLIRRGMVYLGDGQSSRRYVAHNESVARFFHRQIARTVSLIAGDPVIPSYVYAASYLSGAELKKHTDREQCEFSVTLCLDFSPEPEKETPWPIRLDTPRGAVTVYQALGDGLVYRGTKLPHYRDALAAGRTSTSIFFHYVAEGYTGSLD
jgi:hypothetical protein